MSYWTHINGTITVSPMGRTQAENRYILETVLDHLPMVTGLNIHIVQKSGHNTSSSHTEFGEWGGYKKWDTLSTETQDHYILVIEGDFRDSLFEETHKDFMKWLCRLAKRVDIDDVLVRLTGYDKSILIENKDIDRRSSFCTTFGQMFEDPSWSNDTGEPTWCEYLMWDKDKTSSLPAKLAYKYFANEDRDKEIERRMAWENDEIEEEER